MTDYMDTIERRKQKVHHLRAKVTPRIPAAVRSQRALFRLMGRDDYDYVIHTRLALDILCAPWTETDVTKAIQRCLKFNAKYYHSDPSRSLNSMLDALGDALEDFDFLENAVERWQGGYERLIEDAVRALYDAVRRLRDHVGDAEAAKVIEMLLDIGVGGVSGGWIPCSDVRNMFFDPSAPSVCHFDDFDNLNGLRRLQERWSTPRAEHQRRRPFRWADAVNRTFVRYVKLIDAAIVTRDKLAPEAPKDAPFGQFLFAPDRNVNSSFNSNIDQVNKNRIVLSEPNTPIEDEVAARYVRTTKMVPLLCH